MNIIRSSLQSLAKVLCVKDDQVEDALASERLAKRTLSRRGLLVGASAAVAAAALPTGIVMVEREPITRPRDDLRLLHMIMGPAVMGTFVYYNMRRFSGG